MASRNQSTEYKRSLEFCERIITTRKHYNAAMVQYQEAAAAEDGIHAVNTEKPTGTPEITHRVSRYLKARERLISCWNEYSGDMVQLLDALEQMQTDTTITMDKPHFYSDAYELITLRYVCGLSWKDVAKQIGCDCCYARGYRKQQAMIALFDFLPLEFRQLQH